MIIRRNFAEILIVIYQSIRAIIIGVYIQRFYIWSQFSLLFYNKIYGFFIISYKKVNLIACTNSSQGCLGKNAQREQKKPNHVQSYVNKAAKF